MGTNTLVNEVIEYGEEIESRQEKNGCNVWYKYQGTQYKIEFDLNSHPLSIQVVGEKHVVYLDEEI